MLLEPPYLLETLGRVLKAGHDWNHHFEFLVPSPESQKQSTLRNVFMLIDTCLLGKASGIPAFSKLTLFLLLPDFLVPTVFFSTV